jgi:hypothetical protein
MNYINAELRKNNLSENVADTIADTASSIKSGLAHVVSAMVEPKVKTKINTVSDYYANAPKRANTFTSMDRELAAKGNAW